MYVITEAHNQSGCLLCMSLHMHNTVLHSCDFVMYVIIHDDIRMHVHTTIAHACYVMLCISLHRKTTVVITHHRNPAMHAAL